MNKQGILTELTNIITSLADSEEYCDSYVTIPYPVKDNFVFLDFEKIGKETLHYRIDFVEYVDEYNCLKLYFIEKDNYKLIGDNFGYPLSENYQNTIHSLVRDLFLDVLTRHFYLPIEEVKDSDYMFLLKESIKK